MERLRTKYDLVPKRILDPRDEMISTATLIRMVDRATQTDPLPETACSCSFFKVPNLTLPLSCPPTSPDSGVDHNSPTTPTFSASPSSQFHETNPFRSPCPSSSTICPRTSRTRRTHTDHHPYPSSKRHIPSLLNLKFSAFGPHSLPESRFPPRTRGTYLLELREPRPPLSRMSILGNDVLFRVWKEGIHKSPLSQLPPNTQPLPLTPLSLSSLSTPLPLSLLPFTRFLFLFSAFAT